MGGQGLSQQRGVRLTGSHLLELTLLAPTGRCVCGGWFEVVLGCCWDHSLEKQFGKIAKNQRKDVISYGRLVLLRGTERGEMENAFCAPCQLPVMVQKGGQGGHKEVPGDRGERSGLHAGLWHQFAGQPCPGHFHFFGPQSSHL